MTKPHAITWDVFVSHNRKEKPWVRRLVRQWRELGLRVFFDEDTIDPGENIVIGIDRGLSGSEHVVFVLTPASVQSKWVAMETANALYSDPDSRARRLIPVLLEGVETASVSPSVRGLKWIDLTDLEGRRRNYHQLLKFLGVSASRLPDLPDREPRSGERVIKSQIALVKEEMKSTETSLIEVKIDRDFKDFSEDDQASFIASVKELLKVGNVKIINKRAGSVILTLEMTREQSALLISAIRSGSFRKHKVSEGLVLERALVGASPAVPESVSEYVAVESSISIRKRVPIRRRSMEVETSTSYVQVVGGEPVPTQINRSTLYREFQAEREEILRHKWIESEKAGYDIGFEQALTDWIIKHRGKWRRSRQAGNK